MGGSDFEKKVSVNVVEALKEVKSRGVRMLGIVGRDGGYTKQVGDAVVVIPTVAALRVAPPSGSVSGCDLAFFDITSEAVEECDEVVRRVGAGISYVAV